MQKQITKLEVKKGERVYSLLMESDSQLGEAYDVLSEMRNHVFEIIKNYEESQKNIPSTDEVKDA